VRMRASLSPRGTTRLLDQSPNALGANPAICLPIIMRRLVAVVAGDRLRVMNIWLRSHHVVVRLDRAVRPIAVDGRENRWRGVTVLLRLLVVVLGLVVMRNVHWNGHSR
jgi:hypothetical protein